MLISAWKTKKAAQCAAFFLNPSSCPSLMHAGISDTGNASHAAMSDSPDRVKRSRILGEMRYLALPSNPWFTYAWGGCTSKVQCVSLNAHAVGRDVQAFIAMCAPSLYSTEQFPPD